MATIDLSIDEGLSTSKLQIKLDEHTPDNDLCVKCDGLYVSGGNAVTGNLALMKYQSNNFVEVDWSPWGTFYTGDNTPFEEHVSCNNNMHRCWTARWTVDSENILDRAPELLYGKNENDLFRKKLDWVLPGDFFRIPVGKDQYDYYIVTEVSVGPDQPYDLCDYCGQIKYPYEEHCDECGNPKYFYPEFPQNRPSEEDEEEDEETNSGEPMKIEFGYPEICPDCGQPILMPQDLKADQFIGLAGNKPTCWAFLGTAGEC